MSYINNLAIIQKFKHYVQNIKSVYIFNSGQSVLSVTDNDYVYAYGDNTYGSLGLGHKNPIDKPMIIEEFREKKVCDFKSGRRSLIALTRLGRIYSWGENDLYQLGNGSNEDCLKPFFLRKWSESIIIDIKCGLNHCLALTQIGEVFEWGWSVNGGKKQFPGYVNGLELHTITQISCGSYHSLALTDNGEVFSWGSNLDGQCGTGSYKNQFPAISIKLNIAKICCGPNHSIILTKDGAIFSFGNNEFGQLGNGTKLKSNDPLETASELKFDDIASFDENNSSALINDKSENKIKIYIWGKLREESKTLPDCDDFDSMEHALLYYSKDKNTLNAYKIS